MKSRPFTKLEEDYIRRSVGKVPVAIISEQLQCGVRKVRSFCGTRNIATKVPAEILRQHYPEVLKKRRYREATSTSLRGGKATKICSQDFGMSKKIAEFDRLLKAVRSA